MRSIKALLKLLVLGLVVNAGFHIGAAYLTHFQFRDAVKEAMEFRGDKGDDWLHDRIVDLATQYDIPLGDDAIGIQSERLHTLVTINYTQRVDVVPGYTRTWPFTANIDALGLK
ncbi:MAG TPA: hypothetical protein VEU08_12975 [Vicinamibacterales bacterium]|nr:hypothetical protein [Vicinamibacterales bacterium]